MHYERVRASVRICLGHNSYIYAWISKLFDTVVVLGKEKCCLNHFLGRFKVKVKINIHSKCIFVLYLYHLFQYIIRGKMACIECFRMLSLVFC